MIRTVDLVACTNAALVRRGLSRESVTFERMRSTGHPRRISPQWIRSIGMWGGVASVKDIAEALELPMARVRSWMKFRRLRAKTRHYERTPAQLAVMALATTGAAREVAPRLGVLPVEVTLYRAAAQRLRDVYDVTLGAILAWPPDKLERAWEDQGPEVAYREPPFSPRDPADITDVVDEVERRLREPSEADRALLTLHRELPGFDTREEGTLCRELLADLDDIVAEAQRHIDVEEASR